jgi:hypothetical protein
MPTTGDKRAAKRKEKRQDKRFSSHAPIIFSFPDNNLHRDYASMTFNHSKKGLCLEAAEALKPGTMLYIRRGNKSTDEIYDVNCKYIRNSSLGEVRWCREVKDKYGTYFCVGVRYY